ncbi:hypothetical protein HYV79_01905 [Candidatus Woesearchaeota archaeon]|nr:hypothetical protein [Candidatus Woesearchaeota archaeon]
MMTFAKEALQFWVKLGVLDVILPWMISFLVVYGLLERTKVLGIDKGQAKHNLNAVVAFVLGFFFVGALNLVNLMHVFIQYFLLILIAIIFVIILARLLSAEKWVPKPGTTMLLIVLFLLIGIMLFSPKTAQIRLGPFVPALIGLATLIGVLWLIIGQKPFSEKQKPPIQEKKAQPKTPEYELEFEGSEKDFGKEKKAI